MEVNPYTLIQEVRNESPNGGVFLGWTESKRITLRILRLLVSFASVPFVDSVYLQSISYTIMKIYCILIENELKPDVYTSLRPLCDAYKLPYYGLKQLNKPVLVAGVKYELKELRLNKITGRGNKSW